MTCSRSAKQSDFRLLMTPLIYVKVEVPFLAFVSIKGHVDSTSPKLFLLSVNFLICMSDLSP